MYFKAFLTTLLISFPPLIISDSIEIDDWEVSAFKDMNGTVEAYVYAGENVTWTYNSSLYNVVEFEDEDDYDSCNLTASTVVDNTGYYSILAWPLRAMKGDHYFASGIGTDCIDGLKIKLDVVPKEFEGSRSNSCEGMENATSTMFFGYFAETAGKCMFKCKMTQDCFGFEWRKERVRSSRDRDEGSKDKKYSTSCTLYDDYPNPTGPKGVNQVVCMSVRYNNTHYEGDDEDEED